MPILWGAVAYLEEALKEFEAEIASWDLEKPFPNPISCPKGGVCDKTYLLFSEINAANDTVVNQVDRILKAIEHEHCAAHRRRIRIDPPR
jgi:hypothetical protein